MNPEELTAWLRRFAELVHEHKDELTALDSAIGDADHGANMDRGMTAVLAALEEAPPADAAALLKKTGATLVSKVGGASGPLYGTLFLRMAGAVDGGFAPAPALRAGSTACWPAARPSRATRRWSTRWARPATPSTPGSRWPRPRRPPPTAATPPSAGRPQGPGQLPGRAQRRARRPRRHVHRAAAAGRRRDAVVRAA